VAKEKKRGRGGKRESSHLKQGKGRNMRVNEGIGAKEKKEREIEVMGNNRQPEWRLGMQEGREGLTETNGLYMLYRGKGRED